ncbi:hypothetical protein [Ligilactobacillus salivarius]|uniref:hypothetical protein n=1 Tax=Ligilactobacillus salivarius TaxID=1624 RepID=UPI001651B44E|nr:hypothetical protein [Ligilactobacillus salivarius]
MEKVKTMQMLDHLLNDDLTYTKIFYRKTAGVELNFNKRRNRRIKKLLLIEKKSLGGK